MLKIIIELRDFDLDSDKIDNLRVIEQITNHASKYWNCDSVEVEEG